MVIEHEVGVANEALRIPKVDMDCVEEEPSG